MSSLTVKTKWQLRNELFSATREFFKRDHFLEVQTPNLVPCPGTEVHLNYFKARWHDLSAKDEGKLLFLRSSPELHLKKIISADMPRIFEIATCYRNGGEFSPWHHPEFTMLEWYKTQTTYAEFIDHTADYLRFTQMHLQRTFSALIKFAAPKEVKKFSVYELFQKLAGYELVDGDVDSAAKAKAAGFLSVNPKDDFETVFFKILIDKIEPYLRSYPMAVLYDYPPSMAALAQVIDARAKRFEFYIYGTELSNGFFELVDGRENRRRFAETNQRRQQLGKEAIPEDSSFYAALDKGLPSCCGNALGLDRWLTLLLGSNDVASVIPFRENFLALHEV